MCGRTGVPHSLISFDGRFDSCAPQFTSLQDWNKGMDLKHKSPKFQVYLEPDTGRLYTVTWYDTGNNEIPTRVYLKFENGKWVQE